MTDGGLEHGVSAGAGPAAIKVVRSRTVVAPASNPSRRRGMKRGTDMGDTPLETKSYPQTHPRRLPFLRAQQRSEWFRGVVRAEPRRSGDPSRARAASGTGRRRTLV